MTRGIVTVEARQPRLVWGAVSIIALVVIVVTIPVALLAIGGWPLAHLDVHHVAQSVSPRRSFDPHLVARWVSRGALVLAWVSWAWMMVCLVVEARSWTTGHLPVRLPGSRVLQSVAAALVGTALAVSAGRVGSSLGTMPRASVAVAGLPPVGMKVVDDPGWSTGAGTTPVDRRVRATAASVDAALEPPRPGARIADPFSPAPNPVVYREPAESAGTDSDPGVVASGLERHDDRPTSPPGGRVHQVQPRETLWSIATEQLGSPARWRDLAALNYGARQPDGGELTGDHWISAGWQLRLPTTGDGTSPPDRRTSAPVPAALTGPVEERVAASPPAPSRLWSGIAPTGEMAPGAHGEDPPYRGVPLAPVGGSIVGAGVVGILDRMRRAQQRHRASGGLITLPDRSLGVVERRLRMGDGSEITAGIDSSLRRLVQWWCDSPGEIPVVTGVRVSDGAIDLVVDGLDPCGGLPDPFALGIDGTSIRVDRAAVRRWRPARGGHGWRSPAPLLVTVGRDSQDTLMVNLEAMGSMVVHGDVVGCDGAVRSLALELATSSWAGQFELVLVGFGSELQRFTGVTSTMDAEEQLRTLCQRRIRSHQQLSSSGFRSYAEARCATDSDRWNPLVVICGSSMEESVVTELLDAGADAEVGMVVVAAGPSADGSLDVTLSGTEPGSSLEILGSVVFPQTVGADDAAAVTELLDSATNLETVPWSAEPYVHLTVPVPGVAPGTGDAPTARGPAATGSPFAGVAGHGPPDPSERLAAGLVVVNVLGTIEVHGADRDFTRAWAKELVVYLAMHPNGAANDAWATALWPDRLMAPSSLHSTASVARRALGKGPDGVDHLPRSHGRLALSASVVTDWGQFVALARSDDLEARRAALQLVRGRPFEGLRSSDWPILEGIGPAIEAAIVDLSGRLAGTYLAAGDPGGAEWSARKGLLASPYDERLYRMLMRAADLGGNPAGVESVMAELVRLVADDVEPFDAVHPSTIDLYRSLTRRRPK